MRKSVLAAIAAAGLLSAAAQDQAVYTDALENGWELWGWATINLSSTAPVHGGTKSASVAADAWEAIYLHHGAFDSSAYKSLTFWIHGGATGAQQLHVRATLGGAEQPPVPIQATSGWQEITITLEALGAANKSNLDGIWIQDATGTTQPAFYVDDIKLIGASVTSGPISLVVDATANRRAIDPRIYGMAFATQEQVTDLNTPLNRSGGNAESRYNWQINAHNRGFDWYFESISDGSSTPGAATDAFISGTRVGGAEAMVTVPLLNWAPKLGPGRSILASFSIAKYGAQQQRDPYMQDAGNGIRSNGAYVTGNDPNDANTPVTSAFQMDWVRHLTNRWGPTAAGGVRYYILDNEPSLWHSTHRDIHPTGQTMAELRDKYFDFAPRIKAIDPGALIVGPEEWGWSGYFYSGYDQQAGPANNWTFFPDRAANGNQDFMPWFLDRMRERSAAEGRRLLDVFTVHYYPQGGEYSSTTTDSMQLTRNRSTRSLWDPNYTDPTWINDKVRLIPRLREWVNAHYPGTQIGITEYSWGADNHISGAVAQADILGIFGREGLDLATRWTTPNTGSPTYHAIKMYRNYDGQKSTFGQTSVKSTAPDVDKVAIFAAQRSDGALTVMAINKQLTLEAQASVTLNNFAATTAQRWQLTKANAITRLTDQTSANNIFPNALPPQSITLFVFANAAPRLSSPTIEGDVLRIPVLGIIGKDYAIETSVDLTSWTRGVETYAATTSAFSMTLPRPAANLFYRVVQLN